VFCEAIHPAGQLTLQEVLPHLREKLRARQHERHQRAWLAGLLQPAPSRMEATHD
jgi:peptidyl-prolyl cis-trans isomerase C